MRAIGHDYKLKMATIEWVSLSYTQTLKQDDKLFYKLFEGLLLVNN